MAAAFGRMACRMAAMPAIIGEEYDVPRPRVYATPPVDFSTESAT
jgi:hypothetical protein